MSKKRTFAVAKQQIVDLLLADGWTIKDGLKTPYLISPSGWLRLWLKPQSIHYTGGTHHAQGNARAVGQFTDIREASPEEWIAFAKRFLANEWR